MIAMEDAPKWKKQCGSCFYKENPNYKKKVSPIKKESLPIKKEVKLVSDRKCVDCALVMDNVPSWKVRCLDCYKKDKTKSKHTCEFDYMEDDIYMCFDCGKTTDDSYEICKQNSKR
jgi:hypothetical protein